MREEKYTREIAPGVFVDVYEVLKAFKVTCPGLQHAIKKLLAPGQRGAKDAEQDKSEAIDAIKRSIELATPPKVKPKQFIGCLGKEEVFTDDERVVQVLQILYQENKRLSTRIDALTNGGPADAGVKDN